MKATYNTLTHVCIKKASAGEALTLLERISYIGSVTAEDRRKAAVADIQRAVSESITAVTAERIMGNDWSWYHAFLNSCRDVARRQVKP